MADLSSSSIKKTLISFSEYQRLKNIESQFLKLQQERKKDLNFSQGKKIRKFVFNLLFYCFVLYK